MSEDDVTPFSPSADAEVALLYEAHHDPLLRLLTREYGVPPDDAEVLVYETIMAFETVGSVPDVKKWLIGGAREKGKAYQRTHGVGADAHVVDVASTQDLLDLLSEHARKALRLRFDEGKSYEEIAAELSVATFYARHMVAKAAAKIRQLQRDRGR